MYIYRPQPSCGKVMLLHLSVILFRGGVSASVPRGVCLPPPWADTPQVDNPLGRHPSVDTHPQADTPWADNPPGRPLRACWDTHPQRSACWDTVNKRAVHIPLECILVAIRNPCGNYSRDK